MNQQIFYSWQSDLPESTRILRKSIKNAINEIECNKSELHLKYEEATRNETGSPDIPETIYKKIAESNIFICDISIINSESNSKRKTPNPNVLIELGYAISIIGWERIIMLCNKGMGNFPADLPFDLEKRRVTPFLIKDKEDKGSIKQIEKTIKDAISLILDKNPPQNKICVDSKRKRDIENLSKLFSQININIFDSFLSEMPMRILGDIFPFWESFHHLLDSNTFHIYDNELYQYLKEFREYWSKVLGHYSLFIPLHGTNTFRLKINFDVFESVEDEQEFAILTKETLKLIDVFRNLILFIRQNYLEINLEELSKQAYINHKEYLT